MKTTNYSRYFTLIFVLTGITFFILLISILFFEFSKQYQIINTERSKYLLTANKKPFQNHYISYKKFLQSIDNNRFFKSFISDSSTENFFDLETLLLTLIEHDMNIMQIRYIDKSGQEIIRVDRNKVTDEVFSVKKDNLQNKSHRSYFTKTINLSKNEVISSKIDLNIENKKIEIPYKPVWRFSTPVYDENEKVGILIVNVFVEYFLHEIIDSDNFIIDILDQDNYLLVSTNSELNPWTRYLNTTNEKRNYIYKGLLLDEKNGEKIYLGFIPKFNLMDFLFLISNKLVLLVVITLIVSFLLAYLLARIPNKLYKEIQRQEDMIVKQSRLSAMGEMINSIAHQWRQPLNRINLSTKVVKTIVEDNSNFKEDEKEMLDRKFTQIKDNIDFMSNTIEDFMNYLNPSKKKEFFDVYKKVEKTLVILEDKLKDINVEVSIDEDLKLYGVKNEFTQLLLIILENTLDNFDEKKIKDKKIIINAKNLKKEIVFSITDNGGGINKEFINKIFEPYFSTKPDKEGTGLGLYLAKMIVEESLLGKIEVICYNKFTKFEFIIPKESANV